MKTSPLALVLTIFLVAIHIPVWRYL